MSSTFRNAQAGKRAICLDLKKPDAWPLRDDLFRWADVVHHNLRPGVAERMGVAYENVTSVNDQVVYLQSPGWGSTGPWSQRQSFEPLQSYFSGVGFEVAGEFNPPVMPAGFADPGAGLAGATAILIGALHRRWCGSGQLVESSQLNATMWHVGLSPFDRLYETADGWLCLVVRKPNQIRGLLAETRVGVDPSACVPWHEVAAGLAEEIIDGLSSAFASDSTVNWIKRLGELGITVIEPRVHNRAAFFRDPENRRTRRVAEYADVDRGRVRETSRLLRVSSSRIVEHKPAPKLGEHTDQVVAELGRNSDDIARLRAAGVIA
jgi:crotonobetainyl-CoA:carnitine CoA-transferase CaiB-like acyl-CoA transferase